MVLGLRSTYRVIDQMHLRIEYRVRMLKRQNVALAQTTRVIQHSRILDVVFLYFLLVGFGRVLHLVLSY